MRARRGARVFPDRDRHHLLFGKGMVSDDTEHACFVAQALVRAGGEIRTFERQLARSLRWWLLGLPAGVGLATGRSIFKLWIGWPPSRSGVFSAGNGPAMRSPIIGVVKGHSPEDLRRWVMASTQITHSDPKAFYGALAVALAAHQSARMETLSPTEFVDAFTVLLADEPATEVIDLVRAAATSAGLGESVSEFAAVIGSPRGISGYMYHTVPCVLHVWFRHYDDFAGGLQELIAAGGDTDTTGAILGGIIGARVGRDGIPGRWLDDIIEWPRTTGWMERLGSAVAQAHAEDAAAKPPTCPDYFVPGLALRNIFFLLVVLAHGFRRLGPPY
jgi:ADP-ribosylglycohydrolase